jgi:HSP20 family protein
MAEIVKKQQGQVARSNEWDPLRMMRDMLRWDPFREMTPFAANEPSFMATFEVKETKDDYVFKADVPGIKESDLDVTLTGNRLTVAGKREAEKEERGDTFYACERSYGSFTRTFTLPEGADTEHMKAELKEGVLTIVIPKGKETKQRKIDVSSSEKPKS